MRALVVLVLLLVTADPASAECAWVLWYRVTDYRDGEAREGVFDPEEAHPTLSACQAALQQRLVEFTLIEGVDPDRKATKGASFVLVQDKTPSRTRKIHAWRCLPDTVDPRGPKGR